VTCLEIQPEAPREPFDNLRHGAPQHSFELRRRRDFSSCEIGLKIKAVATVRSPNMNFSAEIFSSREQKRIRYIVSVTGGSL
jgi:hypothetical protein